MSTSTTSRRERTWTDVHELYQTEEILGQGTYGVVYKAKNRTTKENVAMKRCRLDAFKEFGIPETTLREITLLRDLKHENIMSLLHISCNMERLYMVCEYLDMDLKKYIRANASGIPCRKVKQICYEIFKGLAFCHGHRVLHRDLKPHNILVNSDATRVKIADFGLARFNLAAGKTLTHEVITLWYRAPELLLGHCNYTDGVDIWSAGCIVSELLSNKPLFSGDSEIDTLFRIFRLLGTPRAADWPSRSVVQHSAFPVFTGKPDPFGSLIADLDEAGKDFLWRIFQFNSKDRMTALEAVGHRWFDDVRHPDDADKAEYLQWATPTLKCCPNVSSAGRELRCEEAKHLAGRHFTSAAESGATSTEDLDCSEGLPRCGGSIDYSNPDLENRDVLCDATELGRCCTDDVPGNPSGGCYLRNPTDVRETSQTLSTESPSVTRLVSQLRGVEERMQMLEAGRKTVKSGSNKATNNTQLRGSLSGVDLSTSNLKQQQLRHERARSVGTGTGLGDRRENPARALGDPVQFVAETIQEGRCYHEEVPAVRTTSDTTAIRSHAAAAAAIDKAPRRSSGARHYYQDECSMQNDGAALIVENEEAEEEEENPEDEMEDDELTEYGQEGKVLATIGQKVYRGRHAQTGQISNALQCDPANRRFHQQQQQAAFHPQATIATTAAASSSTSGKGEWELLSRFRRTSLGSLLMDRRRRNVSKQQTAAANGGVAAGANHTGSTGEPSRTSSALLTTTQGNAVATGRRRSVGGAGPEIVQRGGGGGGGGVGVAAAEQKGPGWRKSSGLLATGTRPTTGDRSSHPEPARTANIQPAASTSMRAVPALGISLAIGTLKAKKGESLGKAEDSECNSGRSAGMSSRSATRCDGGRRGIERLKRAN